MGTGAGDQYPSSCSFQPLSSKSFPKPGYRHSKTTPDPRGAHIEVKSAMAMSLCPQNRGGCPKIGGRALGSHSPGCYLADFGSFLGPILHNTTSSLPAPASSPGQLLPRVWQSILRRPWQVPGYLTGPHNLLTGLPSALPNPHPNSSRPHIILPHLLASLSPSWAKKVRGGKDF